MAVTYTPSVIPAVYGGRIIAVQLYQDEWRVGKFAATYTLAPPMEEITRPSPQCHHYSPVGLATQLGLARALNVWHIHWCTENESQCTRSFPEAWWKGKQ